MGFCLFTVCEISEVLWALWLLWSSLYTREFRLLVEPIQGPKKRRDKVSKPRPPDYILSAQRDSFVSTQHNILIYTYSFKMRNQFDKIRFFSFTQLLLSVAQKSLYYPGF